MTSEPRFIQGLSNPEDFALIPETDWVITSSLAGGTRPEVRPVFVNIRSQEVVEAFPNCHFELDEATYGPIEPPENPLFHGLHVRQESDGSATVYQVNHQGGADAEKGRESIEVFSVTVVNDRPRLAWVGAVELPDWGWGNDVCALPTGGFAVANFAFGGAKNFAPDQRRAFEAVADWVVSGRPTGNVIEWTDQETGWLIAPGTDLNTPNGIEVSADGRYFYVGLWAAEVVARIERMAGDTPERRTIETGLLTDNLTWSDDGKILATGQRTTAHQVLEDFLEEGVDHGYPYHVLEIDPELSGSTQLVNDDSAGMLATTAAEIGGDIWVGTSRGDGIAVYEVE
ncbi:MAG: hypothetical protein AB7T48_06875 [Solirubrobacterales bacterium]